MAAIYQADVWCDDCADSIKDLLWAESKDGPTYSNRADWEIDAGYADERNYDSDEYPKDCDDDEESDCPEHCAAGADCINAEGGVGYFFGNYLTPEGGEYVKETVAEDVSLGRTDSVACTVWMPFYDRIDFGIGACDGCGDLAVCDDCGLCADCAD